MTDLTADAPASEDFSEAVGLTPDEAVAILKPRNINVIRVAPKPGDGHLLAMNFCSTRINVETYGRRVVRVLGRF